LGIAEFAKDGGRVIDISGLVKADLLDKVAQAEDSGVVKNAVFVNSFTLDKFKKGFKNFSRGSNDVMRQEGHDADCLDLGHFLTLDHFLEESNSRSGTSQNNGIQVDVLEHAQLFFRSGESLLKFSVDRLHFFMFEESESTDERHDLHGNFLFRNIFNVSKIMHNLFDDFLDFSHDLFRRQSLLSFLGRRSGKVVSREILVDISILEFRLGDLGDQTNLASEKRLAGPGVVFIRNRFDDTGLAGFRQSMSDGFDLLEKKDLTSAGDNIFGVSTKDLLGKFTFIDNGLKDGVGAGTASVVSGDRTGSAKDGGNALRSGAGRSTHTGLHESVDGALNAGREVLGLDNFDIFLGGTRFHVGEHVGTFLDEVFGQFIDLVDGITDTINSFFGDLPVVLSFVGFLVDGIQFEVQGRVFELGLEKNHEGLFEVKSPFGFGAGNGDGLDFTIAKGEGYGGGQDGDHFRGDIGEGGQFQVSPVVFRTSGVGATAVLVVALGAGGGTGSAQFIVDADEFDVSEGHAEFVVGFGLKDDVALDAQTRVLGGHLGETR
jgi:hypothetical protein